MKLILFLERKSIKKNFKLALNPLLFRALRTATLLRHYSENSIRKLVRGIEEMPRPAYIFLRAVLALSCAMLFAAFVLFVRCMHSPADRALYMTAVLLLENPAGVLLLGLIGLAFLLDHLR